MDNNNIDLKKFFSLIISVIIIYWGINNFNILVNILNKLIEIIFPFILGAVFAFIINIPMTFFERKLSNKKKKGKKEKRRNSKCIRIMSLIFAIIVISLIFFLIIKLVVPELIDIIQLLVSNIPYYAEEINKFIENNTEHVQEINSIISNSNFDTDSIKKELMNFISGVLSSSLSVVASVIGIITNFIISIIFAIYLLIGKEKLQEQCIRLLKAYIKEGKVEKILEIGSVANKTFKNFFTVQCLEATILGVLCIIGMLILQIPYAMPIGVLIGVTALIPIVGAFIGIIIGAILILSIEPLKVITFVIFVLILQQIEGNVIYPKVVGNSVGLPGMWVLVAVTVGGSLFGIAGMLLGVPIASVIYTIIKSDVKMRLENNKSI